MSKAGALSKKELAEAGRRKVRGTQHTPLHDAGLVS